MGINDRVIAHFHVVTKVDLRMDGDIVTEANVLPDDAVRPDGRICPTAEVRAHDRRRMDTAHDVLFRCENIEQLGKGKAWIFDTDKGLQAAVHLCIGRGDNRRRRRLLRILQKTDTFGKGDVPFPCVLNCGDAMDNGLGIPRRYSPEPIRQVPPPFLDMPSFTALSFLNPTHLA